MKIELKAVKRMPSMSRETECFTANIYLDGKKAGTVQNDGQGGAHRYFPHSLERTIGGQCPESGKADAVVNSLLDLFLAEKDLGRLLRDRVVFVDGGKVYQTEKIADTVRMQERARKIRENRPSARVLNLIDFPTAVSVFMHPEMAVFVTAGA